MSWGFWGKKMSTQEMISQMNHTLELGITTFDHADIYGDYTTESEFGEALLKTNIERESIQIISKCGIQNLGETRNNGVKHYNYSKEYIIWSVEKSLTDLKTDYLDLLLLHRPSPLMNPNEIAAAVTYLKETGKILDFGVSNFTTSQMDLIRSKTGISVNQIEFSLTQHSAMHDGVLDYLFQNGIKAMSWSPLGSVFSEESEVNSRILHKLKSLSKKYKASTDQLLLAWILKHPANIHPVVGTTNIERLKKSVKAIDIELELEDWFELLVVQQGHEMP